MADASTFLDLFGSTSLFTVGWCASFLLIALLFGRSQSVGWLNRIVSIGHAFVAMGLILYDRAVVGDSYLNVGASNPPFQILILEVSLGYFTYDLIACSILMIEEPAMLLHHIATILGLSYGVLTGRSSSELTACLFLMELTNPMLHIRWMLRDAAAKQSKSKSKSTFYAINEAAFFLSFFVARMVLGSHMTYVTVMSDRPHAAVKVGALGIWVLSAFWFQIMLRAVVRKFQPSATATITSTAKYQPRR